MKISLAHKRGSGLKMLLIFILFVFQFTSCTRDGAGEELVSDTPSASFDLLPGEPCQGSIDFLPDLTLLSHPNFQTYDMALEVGPSTVVLPSGCGCIASIFCLEVSMDMPKVLMVRLSSTADLNQSTPIYTYSSGFNDDYKVLNQEYMHRVLGSPKGSQPFKVCFNLAGGDILLVKFQSGLTTPIDLSVVLASYGGICILDNLDNPTGTLIIR